MSDLHSKWNHSSKRRSQEPPEVKTAGSKMNDVDWNDAASTDTDMLVSQSVYGPHPVNMGGDFHNSLYQDKRVVRLKKESTKKLRKSTGRIKTSEPSAVSPRRSKSLSYTPTKTLRFSSRGSEQIRQNSGVKDSTPVEPRALRDSSPDGSPFAILPTRYNLPPQSDRYGISDDTRRLNTSPRTNRVFVSPPTLTRYSRATSEKPEVKSPPTATRKPYPSKLPPRGSIPLKIDTPTRRGESDVESEDTDRVMRKSPTGIKMEKMYRDPSTMYPWKTMIQSSRTENTAGELAHSKPQYHSTPMVFAGRELQNAQGYHHSNGITHDDHRSQPRVVFSEARNPHFGQRTAMARNFKSTPKPVFASSSYRSRDAKLTRSAPDTRYNKPPPAPRPSAKKFTHRRSKTVPDLRRIAMSSTSRPRHSRRSLDDDIISVNTADTETLITRPPMPVFDASPSLTTASDSETMVESEPETETEMGVAKQRQLSPRHFTVVQDVDKFSPTSAFASTNPHAAVREELPERFHLWKL